MDPRDCIDCSHSDFVAIREPGRVLISPEVGLRRVRPTPGNPRGIYFVPRGWFEIEVGAFSGVTVPKLGPMKCEDQIGVFSEAIEFAFEVYEVEGAQGRGSWQPSAVSVERLGPLATLGMDLESLDTWDDGDD